MSPAAIHRRWGGVVELREMLEAMPGGMAFAVRDFALVTLAGQLAASFPDQLVFKGGFVLRHALGHLRFSKDVDATRHTPPQHKLDAAEVADAIRAASIHNFVQFAPEDPATDSARGLDFDKVHVTGPDLPDSNVQVEVSYREEVIGDPVPFAIGGPFYEPFEILTMAVEEMVSEKLRALAQRLRATDLADLAVMLRSDVDDAEIARFAEEKFKLVKQGKANGIERIERNLDDLAETYDDAVPGLFPDAPGYGEAREIVWPRIKSLVP